MTPARPVTRGSSCGGPEDEPRRLPSAGGVPDRSPQLLCPEVHRPSMAGTLLPPKLARGLPYGDPPLTSSLSPSHAERSEGSPSLLCSLPIFYYGHSNKNHACSVPHWSLLLRGTRLTHHLANSASNSQLTCNYFLQTLAIWV